MLIYGLRKYFLNCCDQSGLKSYLRRKAELRQNKILKFSIFQEVWRAFGSRPLVGFGKYSINLDTCSEILSIFFCLKGNPQNFLHMTPTNSTLINNKSINHKPKILKRQGVRALKYIIPLVKIVSQKVILRSRVVRWSKKIWTSPFSQF